MNNSRANHTGSSDSRCFKALAGCDYASGSCSGGSEGVSPLQTVSDNNLRGDIIKYAKQL